MYRVPEETVTEKPTLDSMELETEVLRFESAQKAKFESLNGLKLQQSEMQLESTKNLSPEPTSTEPQVPLENVDVHALGCLICCELVADQNNLESDERESSLCELTATSEDDDDLEDDMKDEKNEIVLSPEMAEKIFFILDTMTLRLIQCESKASGQLVSIVIEAQEKLSEVRNILETLPVFKDRSCLGKFILEIGDLIEFIFCTLEGLTCNLMVRHTKEVSDMMHNVKKHLKMTKTLGNLPPESQVAMSAESNFWLDLIPTAVFFILVCMVFNLLSQPSITELFKEFYSNVTKFS